MQPPSQKQRTFGVILLGAGDSSRMGQPKLLLPWGDTSIIGHLIRQWRELGAGQIAVVQRPGDQALNAELDRLGFPSAARIENPLSRRGMFSSIQCAAHWKGWKDEVNVWAIVLGDQPQLQLATLRELLEFHCAHPDAICQPAHAGRPRHPVLLPRSAFEELRDSSADTLKAFLQQTFTRQVQHPIADPGLSIDLDFPEDYEQALKSVAEI